MIKLKHLLFESMDESNIFVVSNPQNVSIMYRGSMRDAGIASIDSLGNGQWWISRVLVNNPKIRRQGIGSEILQRAIKEVLKHEPKARIIVSPGGYDMDTESQFNFYRKNGFVDLEGEEDTLIYKGNQS